MGCHLFDPTHSHISTHLRKSNKWPSFFYTVQHFMGFSVFMPRVNGVRNRILNIVCAVLAIPACLLPSWLIMFAHACCVCACVYLCVFTACKLLNYIGQMTTRTGTQQTDP